MKNFFRKNGFLIVVAALLLAGVLALAASLLDISPLTNLGEIIATPFRNLSAAVTEWTEDRYERAFRYEEIQAENEALRQQLAGMEEAAREGEDALREVARLRDLLKLSNKRPELVFADGQVTRRSTSNWDHNVTLNIGANQDVALNDCVVDQYGNLVGVVAEVGANWSLVNTILDPDVELGTRVARTDEDVLAEGDFALMLEGQLKLSYLPVDGRLQEGDQVITSGLGGLYPAGLLVGILNELYTEADGITRTGVVTPAAELAELRYVYVIIDF